MYTYGITGTSVNEFRDVTITAVSNGQVLKWDSVTSQWVNVDPSTLNISLDNLSDVTLTSPSEFQVLEFNGTSWVNQHASVSTYVRNVDSVTLGTGTAVYLFGATGDHATVKRADNDSDTTSSKVVGLVASPILPNENGVVITRGYVDGINLSVGYAAGDILWLAEDGGFTKTKPVAPEHTVFLGVVVRATNNGIVYVATQNGYELEELHDVKINGTLADNDVLQYNGSTQVWENTTLGNLGITLGTHTSGNYVADVTAGTGIAVSHTPAEGSSPTVSISASLDNLSDVVVTSASIGQLLEHNGTNFVNRAARPAHLELQTAVNTRKVGPLGTLLTVVPGLHVGSVSVVTFKNACSITALSIYLNATYTSATTYDYRLGIYADSSGAPGSLLVDAGTVSIAQNATAGFKTITLGSAQSVAANTPVWLVCAATHSGATLPAVIQQAGNLQPYSDYGLSSATHYQAACLAYQTGPATALPATFSLASPETQPLGVAVWATVSVP